jgi:hypothetical protein
MKYISSLSTFVCAALVCGCADTNDATATQEPMTETGSSTEAPMSGSSTETATETATEADESSTGAPAEPTTGDMQELYNCDPWAQDCPDGYKCMAYTDDGDYFTGTKCTPVAPNGGVVGDECYADGGWSTGVDDCALGHACWNINPETSIGGCVALCTGTMDAYDCPDPADICVFWVPGLAHVCLESCDPFLQNCSSGQICGPNWASGGQEFVCYLDWSFEEGQEFDVCESPNTCDAGLICWDSAQATECAQDQPCCLSYCDLDDPSCKGENAVCKPFYEPGTAPPQFANLGICGLPG